MPLTEKTRKLLWGRFGGRCAKCRRALIEAATELDDDAIVGEECHIISAAPGGPRHAPPPVRGYDHVDNLLLLCRNCHRQVDEQPATFDVQALREIRDNHVAWVEQRLRGHEGDLRFALTPLPEQVSMDLVVSGDQLAGLIDAADQFIFDHDPFSSDDDAELVASVMDELSDWDLIMDELGAGDRVRMEQQLTDLLTTELLPAGWVAYGALVERELVSNGVGTPWTTAVIKFSRAPRRSDRLAPDDKTE